MMMNNDIIIHNDNINVKVTARWYPRNERGMQKPTVQSEFDGRLFPDTVLN